MDNVKSFLIGHHEIYRKAIENLTELKTNIENGKEDAKLMNITTQLLDRCMREIRIIVAFFEVCCEREEVLKTKHKKDMIHIAFTNYVKEKIGDFEMYCMGEVSWRLHELLYLI